MQQNNMEKIGSSEGHYVEVNDLLIYYRETGDGIPAIFLHGGGHTSEIWMEHQAVFSKHLRVLTPDFRGHGRTTNPKNLLSYHLLADDLMGFIKELGLQKPFLCGWSMGAYTALELTMRYPDIPKALVCCGGGPPLKKTDIDRVIQEELVLLDNPEIAAFMEARHSHIYGKEYWKTLVRHLHELLRQGYSVESYSQIQIPTMIMCGDRDKNPGLEDYVALYRKLPLSELAVIPNSEHFTPTADFNLFAEIVIDFFSRHGIQAD